MGKPTRRVAPPLRPQRRPAGRRPSMLVRTLPLAVALLLGCEGPGPRLNAPPHGQADEVSSMRDMYDFMTDNALLADMSVSDVHFLPHRPLLSSLGEERLTRLSALLEMYGGAIRFGSNERDARLVAARTQTIADYLRSKGVDVTADTVSAELPGGRGIEAAQAILIRANEGLYKPRKAASTSATPTAATPTGASGGGK
jgi:hypothetical protein